MKSKLLIVLSLFIIFFMPACELPRPGGDSGDITLATPAITTPVAEVSPTTAPEEITPTTEPVIPPPDIADISPEGVEAPTAPDAQEVEPGKVLVKLNPQAAIQARSTEIGADQIVVSGISSLDQTLRQIGASSLEPVIEEVADVVGEEFSTFSMQAPEVSQLYQVSFPPDTNPADVANLLTQDPTVEYAEPNYIAGITAQPRYIPVHLTPDDPYYPFQWHLQAIQAPTAWDRATGTGVTVAIVDTGIDFNAPDLANTDRLPGYDFVNSDPDPTDDQSHGTHVAGTIAQNTNNSRGVAGVAFNARLLPVKVLGSNGQGSYENIIKGIIYAVDQGAQVINLSLAGRNGSLALQEAVKYAYERGVLVVAAAGNSRGPVEFPAAYDDFVLAVGATRFDNGLSPYSNFGSQIDLVAPGGDIDVDQNQDGYADGVLQQTFKLAGSDYTYLFFEGTSMASPHVAGVAALMLSLNPDASPLEIKNIMLQTAQNLGSPDQFGAGLIQAADALAAVAGPDVTPTDTPTSTPTATTPVVGEPTATDTPTPTSTPTLPTTTITPTIDTPTPTLTPTPTSPSLPAGELLLNGNFESDTGWIFGDTPIRGAYETDIVHSGSQAVRLGATDGWGVFSYSSIWQKVTIPAEASQVTLTAYIYPVSQDTSDWDFQTIMVLNENFRVLRTLSKELSNSQSWELRSYDLSDLKGQTIYIYFSVLNRGRPDRLGAMYVDDVSLTWSP